MEMVLEWPDDGLFTLSDGTLGNPGCECGEHDAFVKIEGVYTCIGGFEAWFNFMKHR